MYKLSKAGGFSMNKVLFIRRGQVILGAFVALCIVAALLYLNRSDSRAANAVISGGRTIHLVTGEFKTTTPDGKEIEAYRWDPGTIFVKKGEKINLSIHGINGASHPFIIEGLNVKGEVKKGKETVVSFVAEKEGTYRLICLMHPDAEHNGPMIGYIVVQ
jgi:heme/copper-type cytochrome/quinol oxidase subunit 2